MPKRTQLALTATSLRLMLLGGVGIAILLQIGMIVLGQHAIITYGKEVASAVSVSKSDKETLQSLESIDTMLRAQSETSKKAQGIVASKTDTYSYQNQIIKDLTVYSQMAGLQITGYAFSDSASGTKPGASPASTPTTSGAAKAQAGTPAGVTPINVTLTLAPGMRYDTLYKFLQLLEGNLLRMEVQGLNLSRAAGQDVSPDAVALTTLNLQVYKQK